MRSITSIIVVLAVAATAGPRDNQGGLLKTLLLTNSKSVATIFIVKEVRQCFGSIFGLSYVP